MSAPARPTGIGKADPPAEVRDHRYVLLAVSLIAALFLLFPSDATWVNDDPALIHQAVIANSRRMLARTGLTGSLGIPYGPLPIHIYQAMLLVTHNPIALVAIHSFLMATVTGVALFSLGRILELPLWYGIFLLLSPWNWLLSRSLWDNSFTIPMGTAFLASYAAFLVKKKNSWLIATVACGLAMTLVHFMSAPLVLAVFAHIFYRQRRHIRAVWHWLILAGLVILVAEGSYLADMARLIGSHAAALLHSSSMAGATKHVFSLRQQAAAFLFPLRGAWFFTAQDFPMEWPAAPAFVRIGMEIVVGVSFVAYPLVWAGIVAASVRSGRRILKWQSASTVRETITDLCLITLLLQMFYYGILGLMPLRHYFNSTFVIFAVFAWLAIAEIKQRPLQVLLGGLQGIGAAGMIVYLIIKIHATGMYGPTPTLGVQRQVARELSKYANTSAVTDVDFFNMYPHCLWALTELEGLNKGTVRAEYLWVHKAPENSKGLPILVEAIPPEPEPQTAMAVLPLSGDIHPR